MTPIERLKLVAELTALHNTAPEAHEAEKVKQSERLHEVRALLTGSEEENQGKAEPLDWYEISDANLPPPYFPCVITPAEAVRSPFFKRLYDEQQGIVKEIRVEDRKAMFAVSSGTAIEKGYVGEYQKMEAIVEYAKSHELRLTEKDLNVRKILPFAGAFDPAFGGGDRRNDDRGDRTPLQCLRRQVRRSAERRRRRGAPDTRSVHVGRSHRI